MFVVSIVDVVDISIDDERIVEGVVEGVEKEACSSLVLFFLTKEEGEIGRVIGPEISTCA